MISSIALPTDKSFSAKREQMLSEYTNSIQKGRDTYNTSFWGSEMWNHNTPVSEDCLYLNIWTPAEAYNLTVMVWLFGGGYYSGSPSLILYDGKALALLGNVIVVNVNYRVGPFGYLFMDDDAAPGNVGMLDQVSCGKGKSFAL
ncbi:unnamed protein product [Cylicostephanus goldi]|uniref:acetylcholinesterase n=1 Tax=Cylicostephanus goldi TaxID=71465 RepID=A0A3P6R570_CYLGO|nr:unnamed protein product [Cylicostephanus goldi]